jgi:toxin CcdB
MGQFLVYANRNATSRSEFPFLVDIQSNLLRDLPTTMVIPLCHPASFLGKPITKLCPVLEFNGHKYLALSQQLAGIARKRLGQVRVADVLIETIDGKEIVRGCRTVKGQFRGVSTFDRKGRFAGFKWYKLSAGTTIPEALAITQDGTSRTEANHYTIAPKDDMPLALFQVWLNVFNFALIAVDQEGV